MSLLDHELFRSRVVGLLSHRTTKNVQKSKSKQTRTQKEKQCGIYKRKSLIKEDHSPAKEPRQHRINTRKEEKK